jgi:hypothetical protein
VHPRHARFRLLTGPVLMATAAAMLLIPAGPATAKPAPGCAAGGVKVSAGASPATVSVTDTTTGTGTQVVVTVSGTGFTIASATGALIDASWCLKAGSQTQNGTGVYGTSGVVNKKGAPQAIALLVVYDVTSPFAEARAICEGTPLAGTFRVLRADGPDYWTCTFDVATDVDVEQAVIKFRALEVECLKAHNAVALLTPDAGTRGSLTGVCNKD